MSREGPGVRCASRVRQRRVVPRVRRTGGNDSNFRGDRRLESFGFVRHRHLTLGDAKDHVPPDSACFAAGIESVLQVRGCATRLSRRRAWLSRRTLRAETTELSSGMSFEKPRPRVLFAFGRSSHFPQNLTVSIWRICHIFITYRFSTDGRNEIPSTCRSLPRWYVS